METNEGVYLLHFETPYKHARHYLGWSNNLSRRVQHHLNGTGHNPLVDAVLKAGIAIELARVFPMADRKFERRMKKHSSTRLCPLCVEKPRNPQLTVPDSNGMMVSC